MDAIATNNSLYNLLVRDRQAATERCAEPESAASLLPRFAGLGLLGFGAYGAVMGLVHAQLPPEWPWATDDGLWMGTRYFLTFAGAFFGTKVATLPTYYFHALLAGIRTHAWRVAVEVLRAQATQAMVMIGLLPLFLAMGIGAGRLGDRGLAELVLGGGLLLPFVAGLPGTWTMYGSLRRMAREATPTDEPWTPGRRGPMPGLLLLAWTLLFTVMAPVGAIAIWTALG